MTKEAERKGHLNNEKILNKEVLLTGIDVTSTRVETLKSTQSFIATTATSNWACNGLDRMKETLGSGPLEHRKPCRIIPLVDIYQIKCDGSVLMPKWTSSLLFF